MQIPKNCNCCINFVQHSAFQNSLEGLKVVLVGIFNTHVRMCVLFYINLSRHPIHTITCVYIPVEEKIFTCIQLSCYNEQYLILEKNLFCTTIFDLLHARIYFLCMSCKLLSKLLRFNEVIHIYNEILTHYITR